MSDSLNQEEWFFYSQADLESAALILNGSTNYHIVVYHAHQSVEKILKRYLLLNNKPFPFNHDLVGLLEKINVFRNVTIYLEDIAFLMQLYSNTRYLNGDQIGLEDARRSVSIAQQMFREFSS